MIDAAVGTFMTSPVWVVDQDAQLPALEQRLNELGVSAVAVVDRTDQVVGLVTGTQHQLAYRQAAASRASR